jgi:uncharacterized protein YecE (DUF72 family)
MPHNIQRIHIGTSGWSYKHWLGTFYPEGVKAVGQFPYYLQHFNTVELNSPFYRLPDKETFIKWKTNSPETFLYSVKASRFITHMKKLKDPAESLVRFMENVSGLEEKLGPILFQLPPHWQLNLERLKEFLEKLPATFRYVFEFRNSTWYDAEVYRLLREKNCAFCLYELDGHLTPFEITADFVYVRLHGPGGKYQGNYSEESLQGWGAKCIEWAKSLDVFVYFDNDIGSYAPFNAKRLIEITSQK